MISKQQLNDQFIPIESFYTPYGESSLDIYEKMVKKDSHLYSLLQTRKHSILAQGFDLIPGSESPEDQKISKFIQYQMNQLDHFYQDLYELLSCLEYGFSISEIIYKKRDSIIYVDKLKFRHHSRFRFNLDLDLIYLDRDSKPKFNLSKEYPNQFLIHRNFSTDENPYGQSLLNERLFWIFYYKQNILEFMMSFIERFGHPIPFFKYPQELSKEDHMELDRLMKNFHHELSFKVPKAIDLNFLEWKGDRASTLLYESILSFFNREMSKAILGQTLTTESFSHGSMAQSRVHQDILSNIVRFDTMNLEATINYQLIRRLVILNYGEKENYPKIKFKIEDKEDIDKLIERDRQLKEIGLRFSNAYFQKRYHLSEQDMLPQEESCECEKKIGTKEESQKSDQEGQQQEESQKSDQEGQQQEESQKSDQEGQRQEESQKSDQEGQRQEESQKMSQKKVGDFKKIS